MFTYIMVGRISTTIAVAVLGTATIPVAMKVTVTVVL